MRLFYQRYVSMRWYYRLWTIESTNVITTLWSLLHCPAWCFPQPINVFVIFYPKLASGVAYFFVQNCQIGFLVGLKPVMAKIGRVLATKPAAESIQEKLYKWGKNACTLHFQNKKKWTILLTLFRCRLYCWQWMSSCAIFWEAVIFKGKEKRKTEKSHFLCCSWLHNTVFHASIVLCG